MLKEISSLKSQLAEKEKEIDEWKKSNDLTLQIIAEREGKAREEVFKDIDQLYGIESMSLLSFEYSKIKKKHLRE